MYSETDIVAKAWLVKEVCDLVLKPMKMEVEKIFLVGSYASGKQTPMSDLDFLIQLKHDNRFKHPYPTWQLIQEINRKLDQPRVHVIFGSEEAAESLHQKHKDDVKNYAYREIKIQGDHRAHSHPPEI